VTTDMTHGVNAPSIDDPGAPLPASTARAARRPHGAGRFVERYAILIAWAAVIAVFWIWKPDTFGTMANLKGILGSQSALVVLTLGLIVCLSAGEFDLSIGSAFSMGASMLTWLDTVHHWNIVVAIGFVLLLGVAVGVINGLISVKVGVPSIVATLGMSTLLAGLLLGIVGPRIRSGVNSAFVDLIRGKWFGLPRSFWFALVLTAVIWYVLQYTPLGRYLLFVGRGREVARLAGIRVDMIRFGALVTSATFATVAGMILAGTSASAQVGVGAGYLLPAYAAAFLGATAIIPGQFNAWGSWVSVYFLLTGITGLAIVGYSGWPEQVFYGGALIIAVVLSQLARAHRARSTVRAR
jgi:ribose transport system permease protein